MVATLTYRTADSTRWGGGQGSDLAAVTVDMNFWNVYTAIAALETVTATTTVSIDYIVQAGGNQLFIHLTNHAVLGPFILPTSQWRARGNWVPAMPYAAYDVVSENGNLYLVTAAVTSASTFDPFTTVGGNLLYVLILSSPENSLPTGGTLGMRLVKQSTSPYTAAWEYDSIRLALFVEGQPLSSETVMQYTVVDNMTFPLGLYGSAFFQGTPTESNVQYSLFQNGNAIGAVNFNGPSPENITVTFSIAVNCIPGDVISLVAPYVPDTAQANISFTFVAELTA